MATIELNGVEIRYETAGSGPTVLFLHGLGSAVEDWEGQLEVFSDHYRVIAMDFRGHGRSEKPPGPYSLPTFASDVAALLRQLDVAPAHVVGISLGGMVAFELALAEPELVRSLVIVNSRAEFLVRTLADRANVVVRFGLLRLLGLPTLAKLLSKKIFPKPEQEELRQVAIDRFSANDPVAYRETMKAIVGWSVEERLGEIGHAALLVAADGDYTPVADKEAIVAKMVRAEVAVIEDSNHATPLDQPEVFDRVVLEFLARIPCPTEGRGGVYSTERKRVGWGRSPPPWKETSWGSGATWPDCCWPSA